MEHERTRWNWHPSWMLNLGDSVSWTIWKPAGLEFNPNVHKEKKERGQIPQARLGRLWRDPPICPSHEGGEAEEETEREGGGNLNPKQMASIGAEHEKH